jgi:uncharacterized protein
MRAVDVSSGKELTRDLAVAETVFSRAKGLLGRDLLPAGSGLWIRPCNSIHTFFMKFPIDAVFLDKEGRVVGLTKSLLPNRISHIHPGARSVIELPAGTLETTATRVGNRVEVQGDGPERGPGNVTAGWAPLYLLLLAAHLALVWVLPYFPTQDGPSHIYNLAVLNDLLHGGREWGQFYRYQLQAVPNLGFHLVCYPLLQFFSPLVTERIFVSLYVVLMATAVPFFLGSFDRKPFPLSFLVYPVMFNFTLMMGFYSYCLAVPLFLAALSVSRRIRHRGAWYRLALHNGMGAIIYFVHLIPFIFFLLSVVLLPFAEPEGSQDKRQFLCKTAKDTLLIGPLILMLACYLYHGPRSLSGGFSYLLSVTRWTALFSELLNFSTVSFSALQLGPSIILLITVYLLARTGFLHYRERGSTPAPGRHLFMVLGSLILIYLVAPFRLADGSFFNERFPWVIFLLSLPLLDTSETPARPGSDRLIVAVSCLFLVSNAYFLGQQSSKVEDFVGGLTLRLPKGALIAMYHAEAPSMQSVDPLLHASSYFCLANKHVDVANYEAGYHYFPVHFSKALPSFPDPETLDCRPAAIRWERFPAVESVYGMATGRLIYSRYSRSVGVPAVSAQRSQTSPNAPAESVLVVFAPELT